MKQCAVVVDGAPLIGGTYDQTVTVQFKANPNAIFRIEEVVDAVGRPMRADEQDWLDLLRAIHVADLTCQRGENEEWNRHIRLSLPLRDTTRVQPWLPLVQELFGRMTHDYLEIVLVKDPEPSPQLYPRHQGTREKPDAVALLSGGLDSARAAIDVLRQNERPYFVSYRASSHVRAAQDAVIAALVDRVGLTPQTVKFSIDPKHTHPTAPLPQLELSQRSRTMLFAGVSAVVAAAHNIDKVILGENGVMAVNCPTTPGRWAGFSTHTAHPDVLTLMGKLFSVALGAPIQVINPLLRETKTDVVKALVGAGLGHLIPATHSCWIARQAIHCGVCVPCVVRRFAVEAAGAPDGRYDHDVFENPPPPAEKGFSAIGDYLLFATKLDTLPDEDLILEYAELNVEGGSRARRPILESHRRWASEVLSVARNHKPLSMFL